MTKLYDGCSGLAAFPYLGRVSRIRGRRELIFPGLPYVVVYQVKADAVEISRAYHGAQNWP